MEQMLAASPGALGRAVDHACAALLEDARRDAPNRQQLAAAAQELQRHRSTLTAAIGGALRDAMLAQPQRERGITISPSSLTLVDDSEVVQSIESSRLAAQIESAVEKSLAELDRYVSSALRLDGIAPEQNPLRPAVFAQGVRHAIGACDPAAGLPALWMRPMAEPLSRELDSLYRACAQLLERAGVRPAGYRVVTNPAPLAASSGLPQPTPAPRNSGVVPLRPAAEAAPRASFSNWIELATRAVGGAALRDFLFGSAAQAQQPLAPTYYRHVDEELAALEARWDEAPPDPQLAREYQKVPVVDRPARPVGVETSLSREVWGPLGAPRQRSLVRTRLRKQARRVGQVMGIDLVRQLVDQVAQDPRLLAPVREAMVALEPSLARLAVHAPRFFGEQDHPARQLLEHVAQRSFRYNDEFSTGFREFFEGVTRRFNALNALDALADATPFEAALNEFRSEWGRDDADDEREREKAVEAVKFAQRRQEEAERFAWELSHRSDLDGAPAVVQDFLFGTWSLVIAHVRLRSGGADMDPHGYIRVIADLLWSVNQKAVLRDPTRAFEIIPKLLPVLRGGLDMVGHSPAETASFFNALERLHRPVLKLRAKHRRHAVLPDRDLPPVDEDLRAAPAQKPKAREDLWMPGGEMRACGFEDTLPSDYSPLEPTAPAPHTPAPLARASAPSLTEAQVHAVVDSFTEDCWVDLFSKQQWRRARLTWVSSNRTLFMFVSEGGRPHSMTRRSLQRLVADRLLRAVQGHQVVQQALDALVAPGGEALAA